jgi:membrane protease YdiL (CAAX protease family)
VKEPRDLSAADSGSAGTGDRQGNPPEEQGSGRKKSGRNARLMFVYLAACAAALTAIEIIRPAWSADEIKSGMIHVVVTRLLGAAAFLPLLIRSGYRVTRFTDRKPLRGILISLPALAVAVNNIPLIGLATGEVKIIRSGIYMLLFVAQAVSIGLFEEIAFRGVLFPAILENRRSTKKSIFWSTVISSAVFGGIHLFNLLLGAGPGGVLLQVGYSFLIGGMCAVVLIHTRCVWICVLIHSVFDFGGFFTETVGEGRIWDPVTVALTALLGVAVLVFMLGVMFRTGPEDVDGIYPPKDDGDPDRGTDDN